MWISSTSEAHHMANKSFDRFFTPRGGTSCPLIYIGTWLIRRACLLPWWPPPPPPPPSSIHLGYNCQLWRSEIEWNICPQNPRGPDQTGLGTIEYARQLRTSQCEHRARCGAGQLGPFPWNIWLWKRIHWITTCRAPVAASPRESVSGCRCRVWECNRIPDIAFQGGSGQSPPSGSCPVVRVGLSWLYLINRDNKLLINATDRYCCCCFAKGGRPHEFKRVYLN